MDYLNIEYIISIAVFFTSVLMVARLLAIKYGIDPIMKRTVPGTAHYKAFQKMQTSSKFYKSFIPESVLLLLSAVYSIYTIEKLVQKGTQAAHFMLIFGPVLVVICLVVSAIFGYFSILKTRKQ